MVVERLANLILTTEADSPAAAPAEVAEACGVLARWAASRGFVRSALLFAGAASAAEPEAARAALLVARIAGQVGWDTITRTWLRRTIALARRQADWLNYGEAFIEAAWYAYTAGNFDLARRRFSRAHRVGSRRSIRKLRILSHVGSYRVAVAAKDMVAAEQHARAAIYDLRGDRSSDLSAFMHGLVAIPLTTNQRIEILTGVVASAAAGGEKGVLADAWFSAVAAIEELGEGPAAARFLARLVEAAGDALDARRARETLHRAEVIAERAQAESTHAGWPDRWSLRQ